MNSIDWLVDSFIEWWHCFRKVWRCQRGNHNS